MSTHRAFRSKPALLMQTSSSMGTCVSLLTPQSILPLEPSKWKPQECTTTLLPNVSPHQLSRLKSNRREVNHGGITGVNGAYKAQARTRKEYSFAQATRLALALATNAPMDLHTNAAHAS